MHKYFSAFNVLFSCCKYVISFHTASMFSFCNCFLGGLCMVGFTAFFTFDFFGLNKHI